jgi:hypothetical protein
VDDRGSSWSSRPGDQTRLAGVKDELAILQHDITQLIRRLGGEASATSGRGGPIGRFPSDPIGRVEEQLRTLRREADHLLLMMGVPSRPAAPRPTPPQTPQLDAAGGSRGDTTPDGGVVVMPTDDHADGEAGDDPIDSANDPTQGPGGKGPYARKDGDFNF